MAFDVSQHYSGDEGKAYFESQNRVSDIGGKIGAKLFQSFVVDGARVLDFGCGGGWILKNLQNVSERVGIEPNENAHPQCVKNGVEVYKSIADLPEDRKFDLVISNHCLEHVPYPLQALKSMREHLKVGGRLVLVLPLDDWRKQRTARRQDRDMHLHTWTPLLIGNTLIEAGFTNLDPSKIQVFSQAWPPGYKTLYKTLPNWLFYEVCRATSIALKRRQIIATVVR